MTPSERAKIIQILESRVKLLEESHEVLGAILEKIGNPPIKPPAKILSFPNPRSTENDA